MLSEREPVEEAFCSRKTGIDFNGLSRLKISDLRGKFDTAGQEDRNIERTVSEPRAVVAK